VSVARLRRDQGRRTEPSDRLASRFWSLSMSG